MPAEKLTTTETTKSPAVPLVRRDRCRCVRTSDQVATAIKRARSLR
jgi:hypothetical protein